LSLQETAQSVATDSRRKTFLNSFRQLPSNTPVI